MPFTRSRNFSDVIFYIDHEVSLTLIAVNQERRVDVYHHIQSHVLNQHRIIRVWMGFSVKWYLPIILSVLLLLFFWLFTVPEKNNVFGRFFVKTRSLLALSTAPGKWVTKKAQRGCGRLRQSCVVFGNLLKLSGIVGKWPKTPWYTNQNNIGLLGAVFISFSAFWKKKYCFSEILLLLVLKCAKFNCVIYVTEPRH